MNKKYTKNVNLLAILNFHLERNFFVLFQFKLLINLINQIKPHKTDILATFYEYINTLNNLLLKNTHTHIYLPIYYNFNFSISPIIITHTRHTPSLERVNEWWKKIQRKRQTEIERERLDLQIPSLAGKHRYIYIYIASQRVNGAISQHTRLSDVSIKHRCTPDLRYITGPVFALCALDSPRGLHRDPLRRLLPHYGR